MAEISLSVHGRSYLMACDDGQENHLLQLAEQIDGKMAELEASVGQISEQRLLFMTCLLIADELHDARQAGQAPAAASGPAQSAAPSAAPSAAQGPTEEQASRALEACAQRIEAIAVRLQGA